MPDQFEELTQGDLDPETPIWRYLTFPKFASLMTTGALWFSKLQVLDDSFEGKIPEPILAKVKTQISEMATWFPDEERRQQVRESLDRNIEDGRELIVANCWFIGERESEEMWNAYAPGKEGVAIRSNAKTLANSLAISHKHWWMRKVAYVDFSSYDEMNVYEAHQACERAFLKNNAYSPECELRVATMNWVAPGCLNPDGSPQTEKQRAGLVYSSPDKPGIFVLTNTAMLIKQIRSAPGATDWHHNLLCLMAEKAGLACAVSRSELI